MLNALLGTPPASAANALPVPEIDTALCDDLAATLYRRAPLTLAATAALGVAMALGVDLSNPGKVSGAWLAALLVLTTARMLHALHLRRMPAPPDARSLTRKYLIGLALSAALWAALPWLGVGELDRAGRATVMMACLGVAMVDARSLIAAPRAAMAYSALLLAPGCLWLLGTSDWADRAVGIVAAGVYALLVFESRDAYRARREALHWALDNRALARTEAEQRDQIERMAHAAREARAAMEREQLGLEQRIDERTAALQGRSRELARQAVTDALTGLPNRKGINEHLTDLLAPMAGLDGDAELALLFLDLDHFKEVNDQRGHLAGDAVLCIVAERLRESLPRSGFAARWGGDEFIVVLPGMGRRIDHVQLLADQLRAALTLPIRLDDGVVRTGCSIGIALAPRHGRTPEALIIAADQAVYAAKTEGSARVRVFDEALAKRAGRQHQIAQALPAALELGQLEVAYQPIVSTADGEATHVEALARWRHPTWGMVSPAEFIAVAEASGHIHTLGRWVLRQACLDAARWPGRQRPKVSVNVSALQVTSGRLVAQVREALAAAKLPASRLVIELTESLPMAGRDGVDRTLAELRAMGVTLAIDDFGTGYSSLSSLMKQPLSLVKVDRSFVRGVPGEGELLIKATVDVARCFGLEVVAEGVETVAQQARLTALGVDYMQGYLFGRPMPQREFVAWLALRDGSDQPLALRA